MADNVSVEESSSSTLFEVLMNGAFDSSNLHNISDILDSSSKSSCSDSADLFVPETPSPVFSKMKCGQQKYLRSENNVKNEDHFTNGFSHSIANKQKMIISKDTSTSSFIQESPKIKRRRIDLLDNPRQPNIKDNEKPSCSTSANIGCPLNGPLSSCFLMDSGTSTSRDMLPGVSCSRHGIQQKSYNFELLLEGERLVTRALLKDVEKPISASHRLEAHKTGKSVSKSKRQMQVGKTESLSSITNNVALNKSSRGSPTASCSTAAEMSSSSGDSKRHNLTKGQNHNFRRSHLSPKNNEKEELIIIDDDDDSDDCAVRAAQIEEDRAFALSLQELLSLEERLGEVVTKKMSSAQINCLPTKTFNSASAAGKTICQICYCDYKEREKLRILPCLHDYHTRCIDRWLKDQERREAELIELHLLLDGNRISANNWFKGYEFPETGLAFELPKPLASMDIAVRFLYSRHDHLSSRSQSFHLQVKNPATNIMTEPELNDTKDIEVDQVDGEQKEETENLRLSENEPESVSAEDRKSSMSLVSNKDETKSLSERKTEEEEQKPPESMADETMECVTEEAPIPAPTETSFVLDENVIDLRQYRSLGGIYYFDVFRLPPQPTLRNGWTMVEGDKCRLNCAPAENGVLSRIGGQWMNLKALINVMRSVGVNIFVEEDSYKYASINAKNSVAENAAYEQMALLSSAYAFAWSRWNAESGTEHIVLKVSEHLKTQPVDDEDWKIYMVSSRRAMRLKITEYSDAFSDDLAENSEFHSTFLHMIKDGISEEALEQMNQSHFLFIDCMQKLLNATKVLTFS
ncbi:CASC1 protein, partial [Polypterus senegalus]